MSRAAIPDEKKAVNAGISLPPDVLRLLTKKAYGANKSKSALAQEILREHFSRMERNAKRRARDVKNGKAVAK